MFAAANSTWSRRSVLTVLVLAVALLACSTVMLQQQQQQPHSSTNTQPEKQGSSSFKPHYVAQAGSACVNQQHNNASQGLVLKSNDTRLVAPVVIVAHKRVHYLAKCLSTLLRYWQADSANARRFPLFVSVDGGHHETVQFAAAFHYAADVQVIHNQRDTSRCKPGGGPYCNLSVHYHMLLQLFFDCLHAPRLLFLEEDLEVAPDFFSYFAAFAPLLEQESSSLMCISAWNDQGQRGRASNSTAVYRTDVFPGLGWMLSADVGRELAANWPDKYWDEFLRLPQVRKGRQCLFPEVSRTHTYGEDGASGGQHFDTHLATMLLNTDNIDWSKQDTSLLRRDAYQRQMSAWLAAATPIERSQLRRMCRTSSNSTTTGSRSVTRRWPAWTTATKAEEDHGDLLVHYNSNSRAFMKIAVKLDPMLHDLKGHMPCYPQHQPSLPRASYNGVVIVRCGPSRLFIAPEPGSEADPSTWPALPTNVNGSGLLVARIPNCTEPAAANYSSARGSKYCSGKGGPGGAASWWWQKLWPFSAWRHSADSEASPQKCNGRIKRKPLSKAERAKQQVKMVSAISGLQQQLGMEEGPEETPSEEDAFQQEALAGEQGARAASSRSSSEQQGRHAKHSKRFSPNRGWRPLPPPEQQGGGEGAPDKEVS